MAITSWRDIPPSQVPQPTCSWKWVGVPNPLYAGNFSSDLSGQKKFRESLSDGVLIGFLVISGSHMNDHTFAHSLV